MTDGRGRVRVRAAQAEGLGKEPERLEAGCQFRGPAGSLVVRAWSKLGNEIPQERKKKKKKGFRDEGAEDDSKIRTSGGLGGNGLTEEMLVFLRALGCLVREATG